MSRFEGMLHVLCNEGKWSEVKNIIQLIEESGDNPSYENAEWSREILQEALLIREGPLGWTPLMIACGKAPLDIVVLIRKAQPRACLVACSL